MNRNRRMKPKPLARILRDFENHEAYLRHALHQVGPDVKLNRYYAAQIVRSYRRLRLYLDALSSSAPRGGGDTRPLPTDQEEKNLARGDTMGDSSAVVPHRNSGDK